MPGGEYQRGHWLTLLEPVAATARTIARHDAAGHAGVIGTRRTTHHAAWSELVASGAQLVKERVVDDGNLVTSAGVTSGLDLALWLIERECRSEFAPLVDERMEYAWVQPTTSSPT